MTFSIVEEHIFINSFSEMLTLRFPITKNLFVN